MGWCLEGLVNLAPTSWEKPLVTTELRASSHMSQLDSFQTLII